MLSPHARKTCLVCNSSELLPLMWIMQEGKLHGSLSHKYMYECKTIVGCTRCNHSHIEVYSHDCWNVPEYEDWDMYWWYVLDPGNTLKLRKFIDACAIPLEPSCNCSRHTVLRLACTGLPGNIQHVTKPHDRPSYAKLIIDIENGQPVFRLEK